MKIDKIMQVLGEILYLVFTALEIFHGCLGTKKNVSSQQISSTLPILLPLMSFYTP